MKKVLLLAAFAVAALAGSAQLKNAVPVLLPDPAQYSTDQSDAEGVYDAQFAPGQKRVRRAAEVVPTASYKRPRGVFYEAYTINEGEMSVSTSYGPYLHAAPYRTVTFENNSADLGTGSSEWLYQVYNPALRAREWYTENTEDLEVYYRYTTDTVPTLTVTNTAGSSSFMFQGGKLTADKKAVETWYPSSLMPRVDYATAYSNTAGKIRFATSKYFAANTNRDGTKLAGAYYSTGAKDTIGGTSGKWMGRNWSGVDAIASGYEAPDHPYVLRHVGVRYQNLTYTGEEDLTLYVKVYRMDDLVPMEDVETDSMLFAPDRLVAEGQFTMTPEEVPTYKSGLLTFDLISIDEDGIESEVTPEIDFPILVVFTGYNVDGVGADFTCTRSSDLYDEGFGDLAYFGRTNSEGELYFCPGHNFFSNAPAWGMSVMIDIERPYFVWNYSGENGEFNFPVEGGAYQKTFGSGETAVTCDAIQVWSYRSMDEWDEPALADGSAIPEWLHLEVADEIEAEEWSGVVLVSATADPLPEGTDYREAVVRFHIPGAILDYTFTQGEKGDDPIDPPAKKGDVNGDDKVDVDDINILINIVLGKDDAANYEGRANVDGEGGVDVQDINVLINIMLGK